MPAPNVCPVSAATTGQVSFDLKAIKLRNTYPRTDPRIKGPRFKGRSLKCDCWTSVTISSAANNQGKSSLARSSSTYITSLAINSPAQFLSSLPGRCGKGDAAEGRIYEVVGFGFSAISLTGLREWLEDGRYQGGRKEPTASGPSTAGERFHRWWRRRRRRRRRYPRSIDVVLVSRGVITSRGVDYTVSGQERASAQLGPPMMQGPPVPPPSGHILAF